MYAPHSIWPCVILIMRSTHFKILNHIRSGWGWQLLCSFHLDSTAERHNRAMRYGLLFRWNERAWCSQGDRKGSRPHRRRTRRSGSWEGKVVFKSVVVLIIERRTIKQGQSSRFHSARVLNLKLRWTTVTEMASNQEANLLISGSARSVCIFLYDQRHLSP